MEIKQSWLITCARGAFSLYEARLLVKIVEAAQAKYKNTFIARGEKKMYEHCDDMKIAIPIRYILTEGSNHYEDVEEAARSMCKRVIEMYDTDKRTWYCSPIIFNIKHERSSGIISFNVFGGFLNQLYNFTLGFSRYDLESTMKLKSGFAVRMYMLLYAQVRMQTYTIGWLKKMFGVDNKYKQTGDFIKKVITPAVTDINEKGMITIKWHKVFEGNKITALSFVVERTKSINDMMVSEARKSILGIVGRTIELELINSAGFTYKELMAHQELLKRLMELPLATQIVMDIIHRARKGYKGKGYIIQAIRNEVKWIKN